MHYLQRTLHLPGILCSKHHYNRGISEISKHLGNIIFHVSWLFELWLGLGNASAEIHQEKSVSLFR